MKIKLLKEFNTPHQYIAKGEVVERPNKEAKAMINEGIAKAAGKGDDDGTS